MILHEKRPNLLKRSGFIIIVWSTEIYFKYIYFT